MTLGLFLKIIAKDTFSRLRQVEKWVFSTSVMLSNVLVLHPSFYGLLVFQIWWPPCLSIVMNVDCSHGEKKFLCKFCCFNTLFGAHHVENVILVIFKLSKFIVFIFGLFQSPKLIKYVLMALGNYDWCKQS
jgi:hypothetical protein